MSDLTIKDLPDAVHRRLAECAAANGRTPEAEARMALEDYYGAGSEFEAEQAWLRAVESIQNDLRAANGGELPKGMVDEFLREKRLTAAAELAEVERYLTGAGRSGGD